jgi:hypothetical protein
MARRLQIAVDDLQHIVEVMRHAAGQLAHRFHLLRLAQRFLGLVALGDLAADALLQRVVQIAQRHLDAAPLGDVGLDGDQRQRLAGLVVQPAHAAGDPDPVAVRLQVALFERERHAVGQQARHAGAVLGHVLRVDDVVHVQAEDVLLAAAQHVA